MQSAGCRLLAWQNAIPSSTNLSDILSQINHFFCDLPPILKLVCGDTSVNELSVYLVTIIIATVPFMLILASYSKIIATILKLPATTGRTKAFSTCSSHLLVVFLFFGSATVTYLRPKSTHSPGTDKLSLSILHHCDSHV